MAKSYASPPAMSIDPKKTYTATIETSAGTMTAELFPQDAPKTVNNFVFLAREGFYDGRDLPPRHPRLHDPGRRSRPAPAPAARATSFADEPVKRRYTRGTLAMANAGPNTNGSQFFVMHADYGLPPNYTIFGKLLTGESVVDSDRRRRPPVRRTARSKPVEIRSITIAEA